MKLIPTYCDGAFRGFETIKDIYRLKFEAYQLAKAKQDTENADHMVYAYFDYDQDGKITTARLYSGLAKTEDEYDTVASFPGAAIYAIHARR